MATGYRSRDQYPGPDSVSGRHSSTSGHVASSSSGTEPPKYKTESYPSRSDYSGANQDHVVPSGRGHVQHVTRAWDSRSSGSNEPRSGLQRNASLKLEEDEQEGRGPQPGLVRKVSKEWRVHEDAALANRLQLQENVQHYDHNKSERRLVRHDIIESKIVQHQEELRLQEEKMREIEEKRKIAESDAAYIQRLLSEEDDEDLRLRQMEKNDERLALELMREVSLDEEEQLREQRERDERLAIEYQKREEKRYERYKEKKRERELERARKKLEREIDEQRKQVLPADDQVEEGISPNQKRLSSGGVVEDTDFTDFYRVDPGLDEMSAREEQERQDAELARILQEQEHKVGHRKH